MKTSFYLFCSLLALPLQAAVSDLPAALDKAAASVPELAALKTKAAGTRQCLEGGVSDQPMLLRAERAYMLALLSGLPQLALPEADRSAARAALRTELLANADTLVALMQRRYKSGMADHADALEAQRVKLLLDLMFEARPLEVLEVELGALTKDSESYWQSQLDAALVDKAEVLEKKLEMKQLERGLLVARMAETVGERYKLGLADHSELKHALRMKEAFWKTLAEEEIGRAEKEE